MTASRGSLKQHDDVAVDGQNVCAGPLQHALPRLAQPRVERRRLHPLLDADHALIVVHAPTGFGKTDLVASWVAHAHERIGTVVWVNVNRAGNPESFWASTAEAFAGSGVDVPDEGHPLARLARGLARRRDPVTFIIDDFDMTTSPEAENDLLTLLKQHRLLRVIVCVRGSHRLADRSDLDTAAITAQDLALTVEETRELLGECGQRDDARTAELVHASTLGWPEPTRALALKLDPSSGGPAKIAKRVLLDQLHRRMLPQFTGTSWLDFVYAMAVPDRVTPAIADYLDPDSGASARLLRLHREGFVEEERRDDELGYRWPGAARAALLEEFALHDPARLNSLRERLATWQLEHGDVPGALESAASAGDWRRTVEILETHWDAARRAPTQTLDDIVDHIPRNILTSSPTTLAIRDAHLRRTGRGDDLLLSVGAALPTDPGDLRKLGASEDARTALGRAETMMIASRTRGKIRNVLRFARATELIAESGQSHHGEKVASVLPATHLNVGLSRMLAGDLGGALEALRRSGRTAKSCGEAGALIEIEAAQNIALIHAIDGDLDRAHAALDRVRGADHSATRALPVSITEQLVHAFTSILHLDESSAKTALESLDIPQHAEETWALFRVYLEASYAALWGESEDALRTLTHGRAGSEGRAGDRGTIRELLDSLQLDLLISLGRANEARNQLETASERPRFAAGLAHFALLTGQYQRAAQVADDALVQPDRRGPHVRLLLVSALAQLRLGLEERAHATFRQAVTNAHRSGAIQAFTLFPADDLSELAADVTEASALMDTPQFRSRPVAFPDRLSPIELTDRERAILALLQRGHTIARMAEELYVSDNTVKTHLRRLYRKLDANSREQALTVAYAHGLLPGHGVAPAAPKR